MLNFNQSSTWRGVALIASAVAGIFGYQDLFSVEVTEAGVSLGGAVGVAVPVVVGLYDAVRDEFKGS